MPHTVMSKLTWHWGHNLLYLQQRNGDHHIDCQNLRRKLLTYTLLLDMWSLDKLLDGLELRDWRVHNDLLHQWLRYWHHWFNWRIGLHQHTDDQRLWCSTAMCLQLQHW